MKKQTILAIASCLLILGIVESCKSKFDEKEYLTQVLNNLEKVKSASYIEKSQSSLRFDTVPDPNKKFEFYHKEFDNPANTVIGHSRGIFYLSDTTKMYSSDDENANVYIDYDTKTVRIDSAKISRSYSFFNTAKNIIKYALTTNDSILTEFHDFKDSLLFRLTTYSDKQVILFWTKPEYMNAPNLFGVEPPEYEITKYELWINKTTGFPYKSKITMSHQIAWAECRDIQINKMDIKDFIPSRYFPVDFDIDVVSGQGRVAPPEVLTGKQAPDWTLSDSNNESFSLKDFKSKVLLIEFTGVGCGPCQLSQPFLKQLTTDYKDKSFELVSIECWTNNINEIKGHCLSNDIKYKYLIKNYEIEKNYNVTGVPAFFILDSNRVIQNVIRGYSSTGTTEKKIREAIEKLLNS